MRVTTMIDGTAAWITPHGEIDHHTVPALRATAAALPHEVTEVTWDLQDATFMDVSGLNLLCDQQRQDSPIHRISVTGLAPQQLRLLGLAAELFPTLRFPRLLPQMPLGHAA
ncbi:STAS domain-containing protein [Streptomyces albipurpureus]|uniref:STAS domain-containing protein n=1 Tax=Streptomyces albipurpureus TaxID=2897419 RepID=A0ABT0UIC3_9ACTN|nr:STAS domain-containing protein [Streptomyces sp. CWNU-1]MCM2388199.1 STAS domain-containing protein [Streptomyces sp. CWNU-1]